MISTRYRLLSADERPIEIVKTTFLVVLCCFTVACTNETGSPREEGRWFQEVAHSSGVDFTWHSGYRDHPMLPEIVGGGVALADFNGDGWLDIYLVQADQSVGDPGSRSGRSNVLYLNQGSMQFSYIASGRAEHTGYGMGVTAADYDNDGDVDLYVSNVGANVLLRNTGLGVFEDVSIDAGVDDTGWGTSAVFFDADQDGWLDLFVVNYLAWSPETELSCFARGDPTYCLPTAYDAATVDLLYRNNGDGSFTNVTESSGIATATGNGLGVVVADFNGDHLSDLFVANDTTVNTLWLNKGGMTFSNQALSWGSAVDDHGIAKAGMGIDTADYDNDGDFDVIVVNLQSQTDSVFRNEGTYFRDRTSRLGLGVRSRQFTRFGVVWADFNNDGLLDIYEANGKVEGAAFNRADAFSEPNVLFAGEFQGDQYRLHPIDDALPDVEERIATSRGVAVGDLDRDGRLDLVVVNRDRPLSILHNRVKTAGNWIRFTPVDEHGRVLLDTVISISAGSQVQTARAKISGSYLSSNDPSVHFGLGNATDVLRIDVVWPGGIHQQFEGLAVNQHHTLVKSDESTFDSKF